MKNGNLEYFIAKNEQQYVEKVIHLANNKEKLIFERDKIFKEVLKTPLYDSNKFARGLKKELLKVYNRKL